MNYSDPTLRDSLASEYALGTLSGAARRRFERLMAGDAALRDLVADWEQRLATIPMGLPAIQQPSDLKARIDRRLDAEYLEGGYVLRGRDAAWQQIVPGVERRILSENGASGSAIYRLAAGAVFGIHDHPQDEECYIISGDLRVGGLELQAGDYFSVRPQGRHGEISTRTGALLFIRGEAA
jgi:quercetin dioxygenase-like cupin family protein